MRPNSSEWRSSKAYDFIGTVTADALAWEFLRRNPAYQREFAELQNFGSTQNAPSLNALRTQWGLRFPSQS